jgi:hypothetical protein
LPLLRLDNGQIIEGFAVVWAVGEGDLKSLDGKFLFSEDGIDIADVVPDIAVDEGVVLSLKDGPFEAVVIEVILMICKAAEPHVIPYLSRFVAQLDKSLVEFEGNFGLIFVEIVGSDIGNCFDVAVLHLQCVLVEFM